MLYRLNRVQRKHPRRTSFASWGIFAIAVLLLVAFVFIAKSQATQTQAKIALASNSYTPIYASFTLPNAKKVSIPPKQVYNTNSGQWVLVNKQAAIPLDYTPKDLVKPSVTAVDANIMVSKRIQDPLIELFTAAKAQNVNLTLRSGYRSSAEQAALYANTTQAEQYAAEPGHSEHQTGLAVDINTQLPGCTAAICTLDEPSAKWLADNAYTYGFIQRYETGKEPITGYNAEAWHYRYVGKPLANALHASKLTLEEAYPYITGQIK